MNLERFFAHHGVSENPFGAEEARHDPIFDRLGNANTTHPDFAKILGQLNRPSTAVVFGAKGSGKTAIRLLIERRVAEHNGSGQDNTRRRLLLVAYDELNPVLDRFVKHQRGTSAAPDAAEVKKLLGRFRLADHQDAILSRAVTSVLNAVLGEHPPGQGDNPMPTAVPLHKQLRRSSKRIRVNLAILAALYDQPSDGNVVARFRRLRRRIRLGRDWAMGRVKVAAVALALSVLGLVISRMVLGESEKAFWLVPTIYLGIAAVLALGGFWASRAITLWWRCRKIIRDTPTINRNCRQLQAMLRLMRSGDLNQPWPVVEGGSDSRYDLVRRLIDVLNVLGYGGILVLVDRVDEPTLIGGKVDRMQTLIWPMFDNKFLQQQDLGLKLLLPLELRYLLHRESSDFFQEARLDKQNLIDQLTWSGATLYDLCTARLRACRVEGAGGESGAGVDIDLIDLFDPEVTREMLIDALDQMHQPRDAFKFLYAAVQEHCRMIPADQPAFRIPRLRLESVRREQAQRLQELNLGHRPA